MRVTVLGCGSSTGVPMIGPSWGACDPSNPRNRRRRAAILVERGDTRLLVDTPPEVREQLLDAGVGALDAVLYTHAHADHCHGIDDLRSLNYLRGGPLDVHADARTLDALRRRFGYAFEPPHPDKPWYRPSLVPHTIEAERPFAIGEVEIVPFAQTHGQGRTLGFRFQDFAYSTDVNELTENAFSALQNVDTWLVDCVGHTPRHGHAWLALTLEWIERVGPRRAVLTHMSAELDYERFRRELPRGVEPAYDGMVIEIPQDR
jgi:phosphoribosyl 1,2-cyclic phosphate phosphodiesterase